MSVSLKAIRDNDTTFFCPHCSQLISVKNFEDHCVTIHKLDTAQLCVWCFGYEKRSDPHFLKCYDSFLQSLETYPTQNVQPSHPTWINLECDFVNIEDIFPIRPEPIWELKVNLSGITYSCERLNLAVACFQWFLNVRFETEWYHIIVTVSQFPRFLRAMNEDAGKTRTLPFSCLCKLKGRGFFHRHFIMVTGRHRKSFWKPMSKCEKQKIEMPLDLLHIMGSLSQGKPSCTGQAVFTVTPLPPLYNIVLAVQWEGGLMEILRELYRSIDPTLLLPVARSFHGIWGVLVRDLPGITTNMVLPVTENFHPTDYPTEYFVYLTHGRKLYFERKDTLAGVDSQAKNGNLFYNAIGDEIYYPTPYQQKFIKMFHPFTQQITKLECVIEGKEQQIKSLENNVEKLKKKNKLWIRKCKISQKEIKCLQDKHIKCLENEIYNLRMENVQSKRQRFFYRASL